MRIFDAQLVSGKRVFDSQLFVAGATQTLTPPLISSNGVIFAPAATLSGSLQALLPPLLDGSNVIFVPTIVQPGVLQTLTSPLLSSSGSIFTPTISNTGVSHPVVSVRFLDINGNPIINLTGLKWSSWDVATPDLISALPTDKGSTGTTDASGFCVLTLLNSARVAGQTVFVVITDSNGTQSAYRMFSGPVVLA